MPSFETLLKEKNARLHSIPLKLQTLIEKQQQQVLDEIIAKLQTLTTVDGQFNIDDANLKQIYKISDELKTVFLNEDYLKAVKQFTSEFSTQATINNTLIEKGFGAIDTPIASKLYIEQAKKKAIEALVGSPIDKEFILPIQELLETSVINGATFKDTLAGIRQFVEGGEVKESKILRYAKQITNDSFAIADRSYTSIVSDAIDAEWFYFSGVEIGSTRCFCKERVGNYYHYLEIESWGKGENLGECNIGGGQWAGEIAGTNAQTIYSYLGGWNCLHSLIPVSIDVVPEADIKRAEMFGYLGENSSVNNFVPAKTIEEAKARIENLDIKIEAKSMKLEHLNKTLHAIETVPEKARPTSIYDRAGYESTFGRKINRKSSEFQGMAMTAEVFDKKTMQFQQEKVLVINSREFKTPADISLKKIKFNEYYATQKEGNKWYYNTFDGSTHYHEMGHLYDINISTKKEWVDITNKWYNETKADMIKVSKGGDFRGENGSEAFAEAFASYFGNKKQGLPNYVIDFFDKNVK